MLVISVSRVADYYHMPVRAFANYRIIVENAYSNFVVYFNLQSNVSSSFIIIIDVGNAASILFWIYRMERKADKAANLEEPCT